MPLGVNMIVRASHIIGTKMQAGVLDSLGGNKMKVGP